jgi:hypothetical protein
LRLSAGIEEKEKGLIPRRGRGDPKTEVVEKRREEKRREEKRREEKRREEKRREETKKESTPPSSGFVALF